MLASKTSIGHFIALANEQNLITKVSLRQDIKNLIDLIKIRINDQSIEEVANSLLKDVFNLRFIFIQWLAQDDGRVKYYQEALNVLIADRLQLSEYSDLAKEVVWGIETYEKIVSDLKEKKGGVAEIAQEHRPSYEGMLMLLQHPSPRVQYLKHWVDASLSWEVGIILADLVLRGEVKMSKRRVKKELIPFLYDTIVRFGAYALYTEAWRPNEDERSPLINSMKILVAAIEMDHKEYHRMSKQAFMNFLND